jgi:phage major head subunit gpT-like protein
MAVSEQWAYLLEPGLKAIFNTQREALAATSKIPALFSMQTSSKVDESFLGVGGMGDWKAYKGAIEYDDADQLYKTTLTHEEYVKGYVVERKLVDDDQYGIINQMPGKLALTAMRTREKHAASVFNNSFTNSAPYLGGDSVNLCSASHPLAPTHSADVQSNYGTYALSYDNLITVRAAMRAFTDDRGELTPINPDTLLVPPGLEETAWAIWKTANKVDQVNAHANFIGGFLNQVIVWDYLTDTNDWWLIDSALAKQYLIWLDRVPLEQTMDPTSDFNLQAKFRGYMRYSYGWADYRWVYGNHA